MKYIRTKDGIFENNFVHLKFYDDGECAMEYKGRFYEPPLELKQADTIEELCDEFVDIDNHDYYKIDHDHGVTFALSKTRRFIGHYDIRLKEIGQIMGAIWTDKGLIYVAKMNEKGELELL